MNLPRLRRDDPPADVTLLLEGTFPMVRGGVSSWVAQLIEGLPDLRFAAVFMGASEADYEGIRYELPRNLVHLEIHYLTEHSGFGIAPIASRGDAAAFATSDALHNFFKDPASGCPSERLAATAALLERPGGLTERDFLHSEASWRQITDYYDRYCADPSFIDYFWSVRNMHTPLFRIARIARSLPRSRCLHAISTGYAGFLGALAQSLHDWPLVVTEHGIYTKERQIDLVEADWIHTPEDPLTESPHQEFGHIRRTWIRFFEGLGRLAYTAADPVTTVFEGNRQRQIADGAAPERTRVIPNGIRVERFRALRREAGGRVPTTVGFIGRVTPIKDIKTFIRAMYTVCAADPEATGCIVGPEDEAPEYAAECRDLLRHLDLEDRVQLRGFQRTEETLAELGVLVLTSISEAQPLVVLEAFAAGVPVICTDVGACSELVLGDAEEQREAADEIAREPHARAAGRLVPIADPEATAAAILDLLCDPLAWERARRVGIERVESRYTEQLMLGRYAQLYRGVLDGAGAAASAFGRQGE